MTSSLPKGPTAELSGFFKFPSPRGTNLPDSKPTCPPTTPLSHDTRQSHSSPTVSELSVNNQRTLGNPSSEGLSPVDGAVSGRPRRLPWAGLSSAGPALGEILGGASARPGSSTLLGLGLAGRGFPWDGQDFLWVGGAFPGWSFSGVRFAPGRAFSGRSLLEVELLPRQG